MGRRRTFRPKRMPFMMQRPKQEPEPKTIEEIQNRIGELEYMRFNLEKQMRIKNSRHAYFIQQLENIITRLGIYYGKLNQLEKEKEKKNGFRENP